MLYLCQLIYSWQPQSWEVPSINIGPYPEFDHHTPLPSHHPIGMRATIRALARLMAAASLSLNLLPHSPFSTWEPERHFENTGHIPSGTFAKPLVVPQRRVKSGRSNSALWGPRPPHSPLDSVQPLSAATPASPALLNSSRDAPGRFLCMECCSHMYLCFYFHTSSVLARMPPSQGGLPWTPATGLPHRLLPALHL